MTTDFKSLLPHSWSSNSEDQAAQDPSLILKTEAKKAVMSLPFPHPYLFSNHPLAVDILGKTFFVV